MKKGELMPLEIKQKISASQKGRVFSLETRSKMSKAHKGRVPSKDAIEKQRQKMIGRVLTPEWKSKISQSHLGMKLSIETKLKISNIKKQLVGEKNPFFGKHHSKTTRLILSQKNVGNSHSEQTRMRMSNSKMGVKNSFFGRHHSEETKSKIRQMRLGLIIPRKDTSIERKLQSVLKLNGIKFEKHVTLFGQPDIFIKPNICVFADGDYWHTKPNVIIRDIVVNQTLQNMGCKIIRFWQFDIENNMDYCLHVIQQELSLQ